MDRRTVIGAVSAWTLASLGGCLGSLTGGGSTGTLATHLSDDPGDIADFELCIVTVTSIDVQAADAEGESTSTIEVDNVDVDLTEVTNEKSKFVNEADMETGEYDWLRVNIDGEVEATLVDGLVEATVKVPSQGLKMNKSFEVRADQRTTFTADVTPVKRGQGTTYNIQPVTNEVTVEYEASAEAEGSTTTGESTTSPSTNGTSSSTTAETSSTTS